MNERVVILGAGYAGTMAALRVARRTRGRAEVVLVNADDVFVERLRLHQHASGQRLRSWSLSTLLAGTGVWFVRGRARAIDPARREVELEDRVLRYDRLVLALGSRVDVDAVPGAREHAFTLDAPAVHARGAHALAQALARTAGDGATCPGRVVVCGGGLTGVELVTELAERFPALRLTLVTAGELGAGLSAKGAAFVRATLARQAIEVLEHAPVQRVEADRVRLAPRAQGGADAPRELAFDVCVWTGGFVAQPLAREAGLAVNERGQVLVDACLRSLSHPNVYAAGDMATQVDPQGAPLYMSCKCAVPTGMHVGDNAAAAALGRAERPFRFASSGLPVSLGRGDGLFDMRRNDGRLRNRVFTRRLGAFVKEQISASPLLGMQLERWLLGLGRAPALESPRALPPGTAAPVAVRHLGGSGSTLAP